MSLTFDEFQKLVFQELTKAQSRFKPLNSHHEAFGVIQEEIDEYWDHVTTKEELRNDDEILKELVQIASCAARTALDLLFKNETTS